MEHGMHEMSMMKGKKKRKGKKGRSYSQDTVEMARMMKHG